MKVIELLNKIANKEDVPKQIKYNDPALNPEFRILKWNGYCYEYKDGFAVSVKWGELELNDEIEEKQHDRIFIGGVFWNNNRNDNSFQQKRQSDKEMNEEELLKFKEKNITDEIIVKLEAMLNQTRSIIANYNEKKDFKNYQMAVYCLREERDNLQQELQRKDNIINELKEWLNQEQKRYREYLSKRPTNDSEYNEYYSTLAGNEQISIVLDKIKELENE